MGLGKEFSKIKKITDPISYNLYGLNSSEIIKKKLILIGNSVTTLSPISAQGFNLIINDIKFVKRILQASIVNKKLMINYNTLLSYQLNRLNEHQDLFNSVNFIHNFFKYNYLLPDYLNKMVFYLFNKMPVMKEHFILFHEGDLFE